jgi:hypothetical protein
MEEKFSKKQGGIIMDINKIAGGNIIPQGATEAFKKLNDEVSASEKKPQETNNLKNEDKGTKVDFQA